MIHTYPIGTYHFLNLVDKDTLSPISFLFNVYLADHTVDDRFDINKTTSYFAHATKLHAIFKEIASLSLRTSIDIPNYAPPLISQRFGLIKRRLQRIKCPKPHRYRF